MAITEENGGVPATMLVSPSGYAGGNNGFGGFGGDWGWIILLLLCAGGGWGMGGFGGGFGGMYEFPWLMNGQFNEMQNTTGGFRDAMINDNITSVRDGIAALSTQLCGSFGDTQMAIANGFANVEQGANARAMANMQQLFGLQSQFADCCCENRLAACQTQNTIQNEAATTRYANATNTRDILENQNRNNQVVLDKLCQLELNAKQDKINDLERQLTMANLAASQGAQTAAILANNEAQTTALEQYLTSVPKPAYVVQNPNCCTNTCGCGNF